MCLRPGTTANSLNKILHGVAPRGRMWPTGRRKGLFAGSDAIKCLTTLPATPAQLAARAASKSEDLRPAARQAQCHSLWLASQTITSLPPPFVFAAATRRRLSGENQSPVTSPVRPVRSQSCCSVESCQRRISPARSPVAIVLPSGETVTWFTGLRCP